MLTKKILRPIAITTVLLIVCAPLVTAQKFRFGLSTGLASTKYSFPVERDRYHTADIQPLMALKIGASIQYSVTDAFRLGTGLQYMGLKGAQDGGNIQRSLVNPNSEGQMTFDVDNSFLILPVEFQLLLSRNSFVKPVLGGGLNFFKAIDQRIGIHIEPDEYDPSYEVVTSEINKKTPSSYFGARLGGGVLVPFLERHELSALIYRNFNKSRYELSDPFSGIFEKHEIAFNMWEFSLAWTFSSSK